MNDNAKLPQHYRRPLPSTCIAFHSPEGKQIFREALDSGHMEGYFGLAAQFRTQDEPAFCGLSTLVMVLNTLEVDPKKVWKGVWRWYHENMLDCCVSLEVAEKTGITLDQFACLASCNTLDVDMARVADQSKVEDFRQAVQNITKGDTEVIVASYSRKVLSQTGDGHFSPIGGYHPDRDLVLMLDTARFKYPPHWVSLPLLWDAMKAIDKDTGLPRGYLVLNKSQTQALIMFRLSEHLSLKVLGPLQKGLFDPEVNNFLSEWRTWLRKDPVGSESPKEITISVVEIFLDTLSRLNEDEFILTTQLDFSCPEKLSKEHSCAAEELVLGLESLPVFKMITKVLTTNENLSLSAAKAGVDIIGGSPCVANNSNLTSSGEVPSKRHCSWSMNLHGAHFVSMLLLSWPYPQCGICNGAWLGRAIQQQLAQGPVALKNEVYQLQKQLQAILGYASHCSCKCVGKDVTVPE